MTASVASGSAINQNVGLAVAAQTAAISPSDPVSDRYDLATLNGSGVLVVTAGDTATGFQPDSADVKLGYFPVLAGSTSAGGVQNVAVSVAPPPRYGVGTTGGGGTVQHISHGLGYTPNTCIVTPANATARDGPAFFVTVDSTNILLNFASNALPGTWFWQVT